jgi:AmiR/NasT family two-component response regulator
VTTAAPTISLQAGVLAYLVKPFNRVSVIKAMEVALAWHTEMVASGTGGEDHLTRQRLEEWLDSLGDLLGLPA